MAQSINVHSKETIRSYIKHTTDAAESVCDSAPSDDYDDDYDDDSNDDSNSNESNGWVQK